MIVYKLTEEQAGELQGNQMPNGAFYNVEVKDVNENIIISKEQYDFCKLGEPIEYEPKESEETE